MVNVLNVPQVYQGSLEKAVRKLFPEHSILVNVKKEADIKHERGYLELDIWIPDIKLGFEFQDTHHYFSTWHANLPLDLLNDKDLEKYQVLRKRQDTLVCIPFWWDNTLSSLISEIKFHRPDLLQEYVDQSYDNVIPKNYPVEINRIPGVGELMLASFMNYFPTEISEEHQWWMGEKYDGTRVCWNSRHKILYSRYGFRIHIPSALRNTFPQEFIDGEIWFGRGNFQESQRLFGSSLTLFEWTSCRIVAFDAPAYEHHCLPFEQRYKIVLHAIPLSSPFMIIAARILCSNANLLRYAMGQVLTEGGEGLIVRKKKSLYETGRSECLLKIKSGREDREALVLDVSGGIYLLQLPNTSTFQIYKENIKSDVYPVKGDVITFLCENYSPKGIPVNPQVIRVRKDVTWESILQEFSEETSRDENVEPQKRVASIPNLGSIDKGQKDGYQHYLRDKKTAARKLLHSWVEALGYDPLIAENWYKIPVNEFQYQKGGREIHKMYNNSMIMAMIDLFPELNLKRSKFLADKGHWKIVENRRNFFIDYAKKKGFDPFEASNWYSLTLQHLKPFKGARKVLQYYGGSAIRAVHHLFPELKIQMDNFSYAPHHFWQDNLNRRRHFEKFAKARGFDPLIPNNWNDVSINDFLSFDKGSGQVVKIGGSIRQAVADLFPEINFSAKTAISPRNYWASMENKRKAFLETAATLGFDALVPENWYQISRKTLQSNLRGMLPYYGNCPYRALKDVFPDFNFDPAKFSKFVKREPTTQRHIFEDYAKVKEFEPLVAENWYSVTRDDLISVRADLQSSQANIIEDLIKSFPEMSFDEFQFSDTATNELWQKKVARRKTLERFARRNNFDPFVLKNWLDSFVKKAVSRITSQFYFGNITTAIHDLFPESYRGQSVPRTKRWTRKRKRKFN